MSLALRTPRFHPESVFITALLTALFALGQLSNSLYIPSMPALAEEFATGPRAVALTLTAFLAGFAIAQPLYGPLSDRYGRRPLLLAGLLIYLAASVACARAGTIEHLILARAVQGLGACAAVVMARAIIRDIYEGERMARMLAYISVAMAVSPAFAPFVGGYLHVLFGWRANFVLLGAVGVVLIVASRVFLAETAPRAAHGTGPRPGLFDGFATLLGDRAYLGHVLTLTLTFAGMMGYLAGSPFLFITKLGVRPDTYGILSVIGVTGYAAGAVAGGMLAGRVAAARLIAAGLAVAVAGGALMIVLALAAPMSIASILGPMVVFSAGMGLILPQCVAGAMAPHAKIAGSASALLGFVQMSGAAGATVVAGSIALDSALPLALLITGAALAAALAHALLTRGGAAAR